jgi:hypothetical protein
VTGSTLAPSSEVEPEGIAKMRRQIMTVAVTSGIALSAGIVFAGPALSQTPVGGCPKGDGWTLEMTSEFVGRLDNGNIKDQNGDGWACFRVNKGQSQTNQGTSFTWKDNTNPL